MNVFAAAFSGIVYGVLHGIGPDHLAALAALLSREPRPAAALKVSLQFGIGHALVLSIFAPLAAASGYLVPSSWERGAEVFGGVVLVVVGMLALWYSRSVDHPHAHDRVGLAGFAPASTHGTAAVVGGLISLSGLRALTLAVMPLLVVGRSWSSALAFVVCFGAGVSGAMVGFGVLFCWIQRRLPRTATRRHWPARAIGGLTVVFGVCWIVAHAS